MYPLAGDSVTAHKDRGYYFTSRPAIHPYVCSTPKDFQEERTYLAQTVFPKLDHFCLARGTSFKPVALEWPTKEQSNNGSHVHSDYIQQEQLKLCLDHINASPFFICFLGHTYGEFIPKTMFQDSSDVPHPSSLSNLKHNFVAAANGGHPWVLEENYRDRSLTELEVIQASFRNHRPFQFYYFRDYSFVEEQLLHANDQEKKHTLATFSSKNEEEELRIWELKVRIVDRGLPVKFYKTKEELGDLVLEDWCDVIEKLNPIKATSGNIGHEHHLAQAYHQAYAESLCKDFVASQRLNELFVLLDTFACDISYNHRSFDDHNKATIRSNTTEKSILVLHGEPGCGKTTAIAKWLSMFTRCHQDVPVISYFVGSSGRSDDIMCFMRYCIILLQCNYFGIQTEDVYSSETINDLWDFPVLVEAFLAAVALGPCVLVLDGVDELSGIHGLSAQQAKGFTWLPDRLPPHCKIVITTRSFHLSLKSLVSRPDTLTAEIPAISDPEERMCVFHHHLAMPSRHIEPYFLEKIGNQKKKVTTLQLAVLGCELRMCPDLITCADSHLEVLSTEQLWVLLMKHWIKHYSWPCDQKKMSKTQNPASASGLPSSEWVLDVLCFICISRCGLHEEDILQLLRKRGYQDQHEVTPQHWAAFRSATSKWIREKPDGLLQIYPRSFSDTVTHLLLGVAMPISECLDSSCYATDHKRRRLHVLLLKHFQQKALSRQVYEEVPWHLRLTRKLNKLGKFLFNPRILGLVCHNMELGCQMKMDMIHFWRLLMNSGKDPVLKCQMMMRDLAESGSDLNVQCGVIIFAAQCLIHIGKTDEAMAILASTGHLLDSFESKTEALLRTHKITGDLYQDIGSWKEAIIYYQKALEDLQYLTCGNLNSDSQTRKMKGHLLRLIAILRARMCIEEPGQLPPHIDEELQLSNGPYELSEVKLCQGLHKFSIGEFLESKKYLVDCLDLRQKLHGKNHILCGEIQEYLADIHSLPFNNYSQRLSALENYKEVIKIKEDAEKRSPSLEIRHYLKLSLSNTLLKLGKLLSQSDFGKGKEAVEILQRCLGLRTRIAGVDHTLISEIQMLLKKLRRQQSLSSSHHPVHVVAPSRATSAVNPRKHFGVQSAPPYRQLSQIFSEAFRASDESRSKQIFPGCSKIQSMSLVEDWKLKDNKDHEKNLSVITASKDTERRPHSVASSFPRPVSVCLTSTSGPLSDVLSLVANSRPTSKNEHYALVHKSAWYHVPGRYPTPQTPVPPKRHQIRKEA